MWRRKVTILFALLMVLSLSGCIVMSVDELYALPKHSDEYNNLQKVVDQVVVGDLDYSAPISGENQQAIQLANLDGDAEDEAIVFLKSKSDKPLKAFVFDLVNDQFENVAVIEGDGSAYESVEYVQLDGQPGMEIVLGRQISDQVLQAMSAYALHDNRVVELMSTNYSEYTTVDMDQNGTVDIVVLRADSSERNGVAELYRYQDGQMDRDPEVSMSTGAETIKRIITGNVDKDVPAVFVASSYEENSLITDIFAVKDGRLQNISYSAESETSTKTVRNYYVYATDIDFDGIIELPRLEKLPSNQMDESDYWILHWYQLNLNGEVKDKLTTYHNYSAGWYMILPDAWGSNLTVSRVNDEAGNRVYVFSKWSSDSSDQEMIFAIHGFSGKDRLEQARTGGRFLLGEKGEIAYSGSLGQCDWANALSEETMRQLFRFIHIDWNSGEKS